MGDKGTRAAQSTAPNKIQSKGTSDIDLAAAKAMAAGLAELKAAIDEVDAKLPDLGPVENILNSPAGSAAEQAKTIGQMIHADKDFQRFLKNKGASFSHKIPTQSFQGKDGGKIAAILQASGQKATILGATELEAMSYDARRSAIVSDPEESVDGFIPMIPGVPMPGAETYRYRKETAKSLTGYCHTTLAVEIDGAPTPKTTTTFTSVDGFVPNTYVRFFAAGGMARKLIVSINTGTKVVTFDTDDLDFDAAVGIDITSEQFGATVESGTKPYGFLEMEQVTVNLKMLSELIGVTVQRLNAAPTLDAWIRQKLPTRMRRNIAWHLLYGVVANDGELAGFASDTDVQTYLWNSGIVGDNRADAMLKAALLVVSDNITFVINKRDLMLLRTMKTTTDGHYLLSGDFGRVKFEKVGTTWVLDGYPIIVSDAVIDGDFFAIDFAQASELLDQQSSELTFGWIDDQFAKNEITVRYEENLAHAILSTAAYVYGQWNSAPT